MHAFIPGRFGEEFSRPWLSRCIHALGATPHNESQTEAPGCSRVSEEAQPNRDAIASVKPRNDVSLWRGKVYNREELGDKPIAFTLNFQDMHLDAMRARSISATELIAGEVATAISDHSV